MWPWVASSTYLGLCSFICQMRTLNLPPTAVVTVQRNSVFAWKSILISCSLFLLLFSFQHTMLHQNLGNLIRKIIFRSLYFTKVGTGLPTVTLLEPEPGSPVLLRCQNASGYVWGSEGLWGLICRKPHCSHYKFLLLLEWASGRFHFSSFLWHSGAEPFPLSSAEPSKACQKLRKPYFGVQSVIDFEVTIKC